jgi:hypothetical protein
VQQDFGAARRVVRPEQRPQTVQEFRSGFNRSDPNETDSTLPATEPAAVDLALTWAVFARR